MKVKFKYAPGQRVKDTLTGIEGIIGGSIILIEGYNQHSVQPKTVDGSNIPDGWLIDDIQLELIEGGLDNSKVFEVDFKYCPGTKVKDSVSGITGIITKAVYYLNGCIIYKVQPKAEKNKNILPEALTVSEKLIEFIKKVSEPVIEKEPRRGPSERTISEKF